MESIEHLFASNRAWANRIREQDPNFFLNLSLQQYPRYLWIGCSDSRVPANEIVDLQPGELFVHRNVANIVVHSDLNCLTVMHFAVHILKVRHIMVVGHYGCSGVRSAWRGERHGLSDNWLRHVQDVREKHRARLTPLEPTGNTTDDTAACDGLCELNVIEQAVNVCQTTVVQAAWDQGQELAVHAWIYGLKDGHLRDLNFTATGTQEIAGAYAGALAALPGTSPS